MPKLLVRKKKTIALEGKDVVVKKQKIILVEDATKDYHSDAGIVKASDMKKKDGSRIVSSQGDEFAVFDASFIDAFKRIRKMAQTIPLKDLGVVAANTGVGKDSFVLDAGTGSGAVACFFAHLCKKVVGYDIREDHVALARSNAQRFGLKNVAFTVSDITKGVAEKNADLFVLDIPEPWTALESARKSLCVGGFLAAYSPHISQVLRVVDTLEPDSKWVVMKVVEVMERTWKIGGRMSRPQTADIGHSGFLVFARRIG